MQRELQCVPIEKIAELTSERRAAELCFDEWNRRHQPEERLALWQWAALLGITKGQLTEYLTEGSLKPKHIPEHIRRKIQRLTGFMAITQYHAFQDGMKLIPIEHSDQMRLKDIENQKLRDELERERKNAKLAREF